MITKNGNALVRKLAPSMPARAGGDATVAELCSLIARHAKTHVRLHTILCNGGGDYPRNWPEKLVTKRRNEDIASAEKRVQEIEERVTALCESLSAAAKTKITPIFSGDARGITIKLRVPDGRYDNWGGEGLCAID